MAKFDIGKLRRNMTHCKRGHEFTPENTRILVRKNGSKSRECITCRKMKANERYHNRREEEKLEYENFIRDIQ